MVHEKPIFIQDWWMDAVCAGKEWREILPDMPCLIRKRWKIQWIDMPQQTQIGGMWTDPSAYTEEMAREKAIEINDQLCQLHLYYYYQQYPIDSPLPAQLKKLGYRVQERVTYRIDDLSDMNLVVDGFSKNKKRQLHKAGSLHAERGMSAEKFYKFHKQCLAERKRKVTYSREFLLVLDRKVRRNGQGDVLSIHDADGNILAAAYLVWDSNYLYYLIPCFTIAHKESGASALLALEAMKMAREKNLCFDFEGSMDKGIANHYKQFGSQPYYYYSVQKIFRWPFALALAYNKIRNLLRFRL